MVQLARNDNAMKTNSKTESYVARFLNGKEVPSSSIACGHPADMVKVAERMNKRFKIVGLYQFRVCLCK